MSSSSVYQKWLLVAKRHDLFQLAPSETVEKIHEDTPQHSADVLAFGLRSFLPAVHDPDRAHSVHYRATETVRLLGWRVGLDLARQKRRCGRSRHEQY